MHRPDHSTADPNGISAGVPGYTEGDPLVPTARTIVTDDQLNDNFEGECRTVEASGMPLIKGDYDQQADVIRRFAETNFRDVGGAAGETDDLTDVCSSGSLLVAVGRNGQIQTSLHGLTWTARTAAGAYAGDFAGVCYGSSLFVAVGASGEIQTSPDGTTWTARTAAGSYASAFTKVTYDGTNYIAVGAVGEIQTSPDGTTWTSRRTSSDGTETIRAVAANADFAIAAGSDDLLLISTDNGATWAAPSTPPTASASRGYFAAVVLADGTAWVAADDTDAEMWRGTSNADTWAEWTYFNANYTPSVINRLVETGSGVAGVVSDAGITSDWTNGTQFLFRPADLVTGALSDSLSVIPAKVANTNFRGIVRHQNHTVIVGNTNGVYLSLRF